MNHVQDKVIAITGAASGFGRLTAIKAAGLGGRRSSASILVRMRLKHWSAKLPQPAVWP